METAGLASFWRSSLIRSDANTLFLSPPSSSKSAEYITVLSLLSSTFGVHNPL